MDPDPCCLPPETEGTLFWGYCPPLRPQGKVVGVEDASSADKQSLAIAKERNSRYLVAIDEASDEAMLRTKSYERTQTFLSSSPTISAYGQLVSFFDRYSLQEGNNISGFLTLVKNATWHLLDTLILEKDNDLDKKDVETLKQSLQRLKAKGLSLKEVRTDWNPKEMGISVKKDTRSRLEKILK